MAALSLRLRHGISFRLFPGLVPGADVEVSSDAAGSLGYEIYLKGYWFAVSWVPSQQQQSIAYKALFPVVITAHGWGHMWYKKHVLFCSDNDAVVHIVNARNSKVPSLMRLLRSLLLAAARHSFSFSVQHVHSVSNQIADAVSFSLAGHQPVGSRCPASSFLDSPQNFRWL